MKKNFEKLLQIYWKELRKKKILIVKEKLSLQTQPTKARVAITQTSRNNKQYFCSYFIIE